DPQPGRIERLEHGAVAQPERGRGVGRGEQRLHVGFRDRFRKARRALRRIELERRVGGNAALAQAVPVEALQRRDPPRRARGSALSRGEESKEILLSRGQQALAVEKPGELLEIAAVRRDGVSRKPVLEPERVAERVEQALVYGLSSNAGASCISSQRFTSS